MAWNTMDIQEQRVRFVVEAAQGLQPFSSLCAKFGISRPTGYLWQRRYQEFGIAGIAEHGRKPHRSPRRTADSLEQRVVEMRLRYPDWGARKLSVVLEREGVVLPRNTIHRILLRHDLILEADQHPLAPQRFERKQPNELWHMDFKGPKGWPQPVGPLSVLDDHSRYLIALAANGTTRGEPVRQQLEEAFQRCGVPDGMLMDHGTPWREEQAPSGYTHLSLWLIRQGIRLHWSGIRHPQTQGKVERFHGSLQRAWRRRGIPRQHLQAWLDEYRWEHNYVRPHEALDCVDAQCKTLRSTSTPLGVSRGRLGPESRLSRQGGGQRAQVDDQSGPGRRTRASRAPQRSIVEHWICGSSSRTV
ncbi:MAG: IS481 family transposase [Candidatus Acidiferrum sp.]